VNVTRRVLPTLIIQRVAFFYDDGVVRGIYFNNHAVGSADKLSSPVCEEAGYEVQFTQFAHDFVGDLRGDAFARLAGYIGSHQAPWVDFDPEARCVADRNAKPSTVGSAVGWVCSQNIVDCNSIPTTCNSSVYTIGDYIFSRYVRKAPGPFDPLGSCSFGGAALFAPKVLYDHWTLAGICVVDGATTTPWSTSSRSTPPPTTSALPASTTAAAATSEEGVTTSAAAQDIAGNSSTGPSSNTTVHQDVQSPATAPTPAPAGDGFLGTGGADRESSQAGLSSRSPSWVSLSLAALLAAVVAWS